ncbi:hypothetical protein KJ918_04435, partial [Patescibacteria group bacterium]|nr:hypothetical protein [Patescibacteria group bacterium]
MEDMPRQATEEVATEKTDPSKTKDKNSLLYIITILLVLCLVGVSTVSIYLLFSSDKEKNTHETDARNETDVTQEKEGNLEDQDNLELEEQDNADNDFDMIAEWATYDNTNWQFRLKYPKDLTPKEGTYDSSTDEVLFENPSALAFSVWIKQGGNLDNTLQLMIANQCSDSITMSDVVIEG